MKILTEDLILAAHTDSTCFMRQCKMHPRALEDRSYLVVSRMWYLAQTF